MEPGTGGVFLLMLVFLGTVGASFVNPHGWRIWLNPLHQVSGGLYTSFVMEWYAPSLNMHGFMAEVNGWVLAFLALSLIVMGRAWRHVHPVHVLWFGTFLAMFLSSRRHIALFVFVSAPLLALYMPARKHGGKRAFPEFRFQSLPGRQAWLPHLLLAGFIGFYAWSVLSGQYYRRNGLSRTFGCSVSEQAYPAEAVSFLKSSRFQGKLFNNYDCGNYLIGSLFPEKKVFIDGRNLVYGEDFLDRYREAMQNPGTFPALARAHGIRTVLLTHSALDVWDLFGWLYQNPDWRLVYADPLAVIFQQAGNGKEGLRKGHQGNDGTDANRERLETIYRKLDSTCGQTGMEAARTQYRMGNLFFAARNYRKAREAYRKCLKADPDRAEAEVFLGLIAFRQGEMDSADERFRKAVRMRPELALAHYFLGVMEAERGEEDRAAGSYRRAIRYDPKLWEAHNDLGQYYYERKHYGKALKHYERAYALAPNTPEVLRNLGVFFAYKRKDYPKAFSYWERYLLYEPDPENKELVSHEMTRLKRSDRKGT